MNEQSYKTLANNTRKSRILLTGSVPYWVNVVGQLLDHGGVEYDTMYHNQWLKVIAWLLTGRLRKYDYVYLVCGVNNWINSLILAILGKPFIVHWIGTDVVAFQEGKASKGWRNMIMRLICKKAVSHLSDSKYLLDELEDLGITASVVCLFPDKINGKVSDLPEKCTVLSYWTNKRKTFYGGDIVLRLAKDFPEVEFNILKATGSGENAPKNVHFLGTRDDMETVYGNTTVLIRLPEHDSLSAMVLEVLARGRYVIYNKQFPNCHFASDYDSAKIALQEIMKITVPNTKGAEFIKENFSPAKEAEKLKKYLTNNTDLCIMAN